MELLSIVRARAGWLFELQDINPRGKYLEVPLMAWLKEHYHFTKAPSSIADVDQGGALVFSGGAFRTDDLLITVDLSVYRDGLVSDTRSSTHDTDVFIADVLQSAVQEFGIVFAPEMVRRKFYVSEMHVRSNRPLNNLNPRLQSFTRRVSALAGIQESGKVELASTNFWLDPALAGGGSRFVFERQLNMPFDAQRYFSSAPLQTEDHLQLLNEFEDLLVG